MKRKTTATLAAIALISAYPVSLYAIKTTAPSKELKISFEQTNQYRDIDVGLGFDERNLEVVKRSVINAFQNAANKYLPNGYTIDITINDIDLAGDRSMLTSTFGDFRVYRDVFPPRLKFDYVVLDSNEKVVAQGQEAASDLTYTNNIWGARTWSAEEAPFITELVRGWASNELRRAVKE